MQVTLKFWKDNLVAKLDGDECRWMEMTKKANEEEETEEAANDEDEEEEEDDDDDDDDVIFDIDTS